MARGKTFLSIFSLNDQLLLTDYFNDLNNKVLLNKKDKRLFIKDFEKAILFYYKKNYKIKKILKLLKTKNLSDFYINNSNRWYPLDYAAKIYPLSMKNNFMSTFRISIYLKEEVIPEVLQIALTFTVKRFPSFATTVRKGFFWHYLDGIKRRFAIYSEMYAPCNKINISKINKKTFKILYYKNRISGEFFHVLTDGTGGMVFMKTLVAEYLRLLGKEITYTDEVLNPKDSPLDEELSNDFIKFEKKTKKERLGDKTAMQLDGKLSRVKPCQIIHFDMSLKDVKKICEEKRVTITNFLLGILFTICSYSTSEKGIISIQVPVSLRKYYNSKTLRNFSLYTNIIIKNTEIEDFDTLLQNIKNQLEIKTDKEKMNNLMAHTYTLINSIKFIPLFVKTPITKLIYGFVGEKSNTTVLSNLGLVKFPSSFAKEIEKMDFVLGTTSLNRALFSAISCNNILTLTMSKLTINKALENTLYNLLKSYNINLKVYGSDEYENK